MYLKETIRIHSCIENNKVHAHKMVSHKTMVLGKFLADSINSFSQTLRNRTLHKVHTIYKQQQLIVGQMKGERGSAMEGATTTSIFLMDWAHGTCRTP
jgi:hypothetical protein